MPSAVEGYDFTFSKTVYAPGKIGKYATFIEVKYETVDTSNIPSRGIADVFTARLDDEPANAAATPPAVPNELSWYSPGSLGGRRGASGRDREVSGAMSDRDDDAGGDGRGPAVGLFCPSWPPGRVANGIVTYTGTIAEGLRRRGRRVRILTPDLDEAAGGGPEVRAVAVSAGSGGLAARVRRRLDAVRPGRFGGDRGAEIGRGLRRAVRRLADDGEIGLLEMEESFGWSGAVAGRVPVPVVVRLHGPWFLSGPADGHDAADPAFGRRTRAEGVGLRRASAITAPSRDVLRRVLDYYGPGLPPSEVIPNPVPSVPEADRWRAEGCDPDLILFVGRVSRLKGVDLVVDALARLRCHRPSTRLMIVGPGRRIVGGDGRPIDIEEGIERRLPGALSDGGVVLTGALPPIEVDRLRRRAAVTVVASRYETFSLTTVEAMASGCPMVASRAGGIAELFDHGVHGLYFEPGDPADLADKIGSLLRDPEAASAMGRRAASHSLDRYSTEAIAERTDAFYDRVLAGTPFGRARR